MSEPPDPGRPVDLHVHTSRRGSTARLTLAGELDLDRCRALTDVVQELVVDGYTHLEVNLRRLTFCDSRGLAALLGAAETCRLAGGQLIVTDPMGTVRHVMIITGVDALLCEQPLSNDVVEPRQRPATG